MFIVDVGFSCVKWMTEDTKGIYRTIYRTSKKDEGLLYKEKRYVVGERALLKTDPCYLRTIDELIDLYPLFTAFAAQKAQIDKSDILVIGLPFDYWKIETAKSARGMHSIIEKLKDSLIAIKLEDTEYKFDDIVVLPQGVGCINAYLNDTTGIKGNILGIDIGFNTIVYSLFSVDENDTLYGKTLYKKGIHDMAINLINPVLEKYTPGKYYSPVEINYIIEKRQIQKGFDLIDISTEIDSAAKEYIESIFSYIIGDLSENIGVITFDTIVIGGGGARAIKELSPYKVNIKVLEEPEYANVRGFKSKAIEIKPPIKEIIKPEIMETPHSIQPQITNVQTPTEEVKEEVKNEGDKTIEIKEPEEISHTATTMEREKHYKVKKKSTEY
ncbi:MAG: ParM/StbA family protein [Candidatus Magnetoovum sp. WYHC-5]|nr:ParM/StbA family protein [Candidatus Magnetoovum sp. WYHC-5]